MAASITKLIINNPFDEPARHWHYQREGMDCLAELGHLAKNLRAEIDEELIEAYRGSVSLPFTPGEYKRIAVKIVDDRAEKYLR